jgi:hypothetical protein
MRPGVLRAGLLVAAAFAGCDSPTEPVDHRAVQRVSLEQVVTDEVAAADTVRRYSFVASQTGLHGLFVQALEGQASLVVRDSVTQGVRTSLFLSPRAGGLEAEATLPFALTAGQAYLVEVRALPLGSAARFRFQVHHINPDPEHQLLPGQFSIGDVISNESIDDILDVDDYTTIGTAGQEIAGAIQATGTSGTEGITLTVFDPSQFFQTYTFTSAGEPGSVTGRLTLQTSGTYRFRVQGIYGAKGRYTGPFRFWTYFITRAPEHHAAAVNYDTAITGENLAPAGDVDEFTFYADAGSEYNVFLHSARSPFVRLQAFDQGGNYVAFVDAVAADTGLFDHATGRFLRASPGTLTLRVFGEADHSVSDTGSYRLYIDRINPLPEHVAAAIVPGDTIAGESIDQAGDVDEFTFSGNAGDEMRLAFQSLPPSDVLRADVLSPGNQSIAYAETFFSDTTLYQSVTGMFTLPATGTYRIRVASPNSRSGDDTGPYRFFLYRINRQPESTPATLALGDSLTGEGIEVAGDIDEFRVVVPDSTGAYLVVELESPLLGSGSLFAEIVDSATGEVKGSAAIQTAGVRSPSGRLKLGPGAHIVRVATALLPTLRATYRIWLYSFSMGPEAVADTFAIGDTVTGESVEPWGDADIFHFYGVRGDHVNVLFQGLAPVFETVWLRAWLTTPGSPEAYPAVIVGSPTSSASLESFQSTRLDLPVTGWYNLMISGASNVIGERGPYRFAIVREDSLPEHVSASLVPGDSVGNEPIDTPGDWDQFAVTATPGQELGIIFDGKDGTVDPFPYVRARDPANDDSLAGTVGQSERFTGPFTVPASGQVKITVYEPVGFYRTCSDATCGSAFRFVGPYGLSVVTVNRAPESAAAAYTVGDTLRGEAIATIGDFDQFTSSGTPGEPLGVFFRMTAPPVGQQFHGLTVEIIDPATGDTLAGRGAETFGQQFWQVGAFNVPAGGNFVIRVRGTGFWGEDLTTGPYEFFIKR